MLVGTKMNGLYVIKDVEMIQITLAISDKGPSEGDLWHKRLSHINSKGLDILSNQGILPKGLCDYLSFCETCIIGKSTRQSFSKGQHTSNETLEYIHSNLWGPSHTPLSGARYFLTFIDDFCEKKKGIFFPKN